MPDRRSPRRHRLLTTLETARRMPIRRAISATRLLPAPAGGGQRRQQKTDPVEAARRQRHLRGAVHGLCLFRLRTPRRHGGTRMNDGIVIQSPQQATCPLPAVPRCRRHAAKTSLPLGTRLAREDSRSAAVVSVLAGSLRPGSQKPASGLCVLGVAEAGPAAVCVSATLFPRPGAAGADHHLATAARDRRHRHHADRLLAGLDHG